MMNDINDHTGESGGYIPGSDGKRAFVLTGITQTPLPVLISVPHAGRDYPEQLLAKMRRSAQTTLRLEDRYVDLIGRTVAEQTGAALLVAHAPRAMIDLNRATDDMDWSMVSGGARDEARHSLANRRSRSGLGLVPRRLAGIGEIWSGPIERAELDSRIADIHQPYHAALGHSLDLIRDRWGAALLIDLHSMPPLRPRHPGERTAEFVIGDRFGASCVPEIAATALDYFGQHGRLVAHNRPYAGGYVLDRHALPARGIHAIQIEICRSSYLDSHLSEPSVRMNGVARLVAGLVSRLAGQIAELGSGSAIPLAAE